MKQSLSYSLKVWGTSIVLGPFVMVILTKLILPHELVFDSFTNIAGSICIFISYSAVLTLPVWLVAWLCTSMLLLLNYKAVYKKLILTIIGCSLSAVVFYLLSFEHDSPWGPDMAISLCAYMIVVVGGIWLYKLDKEATRIINLPNTHEAGTSI